MSSPHSSSPNSVHVFPPVAPVASLPRPSQQSVPPQSPLMFKDQMQQDVIMVLKFPSNSPVTHVAANTLPHLTMPAVVTVTCSRLFAVNRWHNTVGEQRVKKWPRFSHSNKYAASRHGFFYLLKKREHFRRFIMRRLKVSRQPFFFMNCSTSNSH